MELSRHEKQLKVVLERRRDKLQRELNDVQTRIMNLNRKEIEEDGKSPDASTQGLHRGDRDRPRSRP